MSVVRIPGHKPPNQATTMMAGKSVMYGSLTPHTGSRASRATIAMIAATVATPYLAGVDRRIARPAIAGASDLARVSRWNADFRKPSHLSLSHKNRVRERTLAFATANLRQLTPGV